MSAMTINFARNQNYWRNWANWINTRMRKSYRWIYKARFCSIIHKRDLQEIQSGALCSFKSPFIIEEREKLLKYFNELAYEHVPSVRDGKIISILTLLQVLRKISAIPFSHKLIPIIVETNFDYHLSCPIYSILQIYLRLVLV